MKYYKKTTWLGLLLPMLLLLSACGESDVVFTTTAPSTTTTAKTTTASTTTITTATVKTTTAVTTTIATATADPMTAVKTTTTIVPTASVETTTAQTSTTSKRVIVVGTTTTKTRPGYTIPSVPAEIKEEDLQTGMLGVDSPKYYLHSYMTVRIQNTTDKTITVDKAYAVLEKGDSGEWKCVYKREDYGPRDFSVGGMYMEYISLGTFADGKLKEGHTYKLIWAVNGQWHGVDFYIEPDPPPFTENDLRTDVTMTITPKVYAHSDNMIIRIKNTTDHDVVINDVFTVLRKDDSGVWKKVEQKMKYDPQILKPGEEYTKMKESGKIDSAYHLSQGEECLLAWLVDNQWVAAEFTIK